MVASLGRLGRQQGVGASSLEMLTGASGGTIWGAGTGGVVGVSALLSQFLGCFSQPHLLSFLVVFSYLAVSGFCIVFLKFHVSYFLK